MCHPLQWPELQGPQGLPRSVPTAHDVFPNVRGKQDDDDKPVEKLPGGQGFLFSAMLLSVVFYLFTFTKHELVVRVFGHLPPCQEKLAATDELKAEIENSQKSLIEEEFEWLRTCTRRSLSLRPRPLARQPQRLTMPLLISKPKVLGGGKDLHEFHLHRNARRQGHPQSKKGQQQSGNQSLWDR